MTDPALIAFCGVDCAACTDYAENKCPSCRKTVWKDGDECMPVACCKKRGVSYCGECPVFPCPDMKDFYEESDGHREAFVRMKSLCENRTR